MSSDDLEMDLSDWQLIKHVAGALPIGLLLGFLAGTPVYVLFMHVLTLPELLFLMPDSFILLYRVTGALCAVPAGLCATGLWIYYAEDASTGIRLSEVLEETDGQS